eukprot:PhF_6_TR40545/c0_g1_i2/m.60762
MSEDGDATLPPPPLEEPAKRRKTNDGDAAPVAPSKPEETSDKESEEAKPAPTRKAAPKATKKKAAAPQQDEGESGGLSIAAALKARKEAKPEVVKPNAKWFYKSDLRKDGVKDEAWDPYNDADSIAIEKGYQLFLKSKYASQTMKLNAKYSVDFSDMTQFQTKQSDRQRPIRRVTNEEV